MSNDHTNTGTDGTGGASFEQGQDWAGPDGGSSSHLYSNPESGSGHHNESGLLTGILGGLGR
ncbi:hypothetical protein AB0F91_09945 [Amycolatopsis sp. NPDC023774]|uniref:hypothetical protein n=1 Tax=Amycolatopsis sp. NPDC023774 TaxID=3155015 RepID=UPI0033EAB860